MKIKKRPLVPLPVVQRVETSPGPLWNLYRDGITQGLLGAFLNCPEKTRLGQIQGLSFPGGGSGAMAFGTLVHEVLDRTYTQYRDIKNQSDRSWLSGFLSDTLKEMELRDLKTLEDNVSTTVVDVMGLEENYGMAEALLPAYFTRWHQDFLAHDWIQLERTFDFPYDPVSRLGLNRPKIRVRGKRDGDFRSGGLWLFETKTKGRIEEESIVDTLGINLQVMLYLLSMKHDYNETPKGVVYNIIRRPQLRQTKKESLRDLLNRITEDVDKRPEFYFIRFTASILPEEQALWERDFDSMMERLILWYDGQMDGSGNGHFRNPGACNGVRACSFIPVCGRHDTSRFVRRGCVFPELELDA